MNRYISFLLVIVLAILSHLVIFMQAPLLWQTGAVLLLAGLLPGALLVEWLVGGGDAPPTEAERILYSSGAGYAIMVVVMLLVSYLPGPVARWQTFVAFDLVLLLGLLLCAYRRPLSRTPALTGSHDPSAAPKPCNSRFSWWGMIKCVTTRHGLLAALLSLALVGGFFRLVNLDYSEFQGDEARAAQRAAAVIQGYEDVLLIHKKGPMEVLVPTVLYSMTGVLNEQMARLPFALANWTALFALFLLGWRLFGPVAGWAAAILLALDGYFIGFSHIVQYQSVIFLTSVLAVLIVHRLLLWPTGRAGPRRAGPIRAARYLTLAALLLAAGALSHYEAVWALIPVAYLFLLYAWRHTGLLQAIGSVVPGIVIGGGVLAIFYVPFVLHPHFSATLTYLLDRRVGVGSGSSFPYNNLADFFIRTTLYSTTYYVLLMMLLTMIALLVAYARLGRVGQVLGGVVTVGLLLALFDPTWLTFNGTDWMVLWFALALVSVCLMPRLSYQERMLWLWFSIPLLIAFFFTAKPRTHVYVFFIPWALLAGLVLQWGLEWLTERIGQQRAAAVAVALATLAITIFGSYAYWYFIHNQVEILRTWHENRPAGFWTVYERPDEKAIFGFPLANGWKVVGSLYEQGVLSGNYSTNEKESWVPDWYTRGQTRCPTNAEWFFQIENLEPFDNEDRLIMEEQLRQGFQKWAEVEINGRPRMIIHKRSDEPVEPRTIPLDEWVTVFDQNASPYFPLGYPTVVPKEIPNPTHINLGNLIWLEGYDLEYEKPLNPGDTFVFTLYWRTQQPIMESYKVFNHVYFGDSGMQAQLDGYPICGQRPTWRWDPGELITDKYFIQVNPDATPGLYPIYTGMYIEETGKRLHIFDEAGNDTGSQIHVTEIRIGEE